MVQTQPVKALVLGANGLLGQSLRQILTAQGHSFKGLSHRELDITRPEEVTRCLESNPVDVIYNATGMTAVDEAEEKRTLAFAVNAEGPRHMAHWCHKHSTQLVHISTDYVFDGIHDTPYRENEPTSAAGVYAQSKEQGEKWVLEENPSALVVRVAGTFGAGGKSFVCRLKELILEPRILRIVNDRIGNYTYAPDAAIALEALVRKQATGLVHFANSGGLSMYDFAIALKAKAEELGLQPQNQQILPASGAELNLAAPRPAYSCLDTTRYQQITGLKIRLWQETLKDFLQN